VVLRVKTFEIKKKIRNYENCTRAKTKRKKEKKRNPTTTTPQKKTLLCHVMEPNSSEDRATQ
jgi:hypothetical protein